MEKIEQRIIAKLGLSIISTDVSDKSKIWSEATCQDVLHSIFCLRRDIKDVLDDFICYQEEGLNGNIFEKDIVVSVVEFIAQVLRPFGLKWHSRLFRNTEFIGVKVTSIPKEYIDLTYRADFVKDFIEIQKEMTRRFDKWGLICSTN